MRSPERIPEFLEHLENIWNKYSDLRLGQLLINAAACAGWSSSNIFQIEEDMLYEGLYKFDELQEQLKRAKKLNNIKEGE